MFVVSRLVLSARANEKPMPDPIRILIVLLVASLGAFLVAPPSERRFGKKAVLKWGLVVAIAVAFAAIGMAIILSLRGGQGE